jgi:drug/metabolite transporter (DMT)-like permease
MKDKKTLANFKGCLAVLLWSFSALYIGWTSQAPPFLLAALSSIIGSIYFFLTCLANPAKFSFAIRQKWEVWALFFSAVVFYRALYLTSLKLAPIVEANLLNYLWPLFIILFSALIDHIRLSKKVYLGAVFCFAGAVCIGISKKGNLSFEAGHILAIGGALTWAIYSIMTSRLSSAPIGMIGLMHVIAVCVFLVLHIVFEQTTNVWNLPLLCWIGVTGLGLAMSLGYNLWHEAMRYGNRETLAVVGYYTPLLSTLWLILFGDQQITSWVWLAIVLIIGGSLFSRLNAENEIINHAEVP